MYKNVSWRDPFPVIILWAKIFLQNRHFNHRIKIQSELNVLAFPPDSRYDIVHPSDGIIENKIVWFKTSNAGRPLKLLVFLDFLALENISFETLSVLNQQTTTTLLHSTTLRRLWDFPEVLYKMRYVCILL